MDNTLNRKSFSGVKETFKERPDSGLRGVDFPATSQNAEMKQRDTQGRSKAHRTIKLPLPQTSPCLLMGIPAPLMP
jgi:hypothetical protein